MFWKDERDSGFRFFECKRTDKKEGRVNNVRVLTIHCRIDSKRGRYFYYSTPHSQNKRNVSSLVPAHTVGYLVPNVAKLQFRYKICVGVYVTDLR